MAILAQMSLTDTKVLEKRHIICSPTTHILLYYIIDSYAMQGYWTTHYHMKCSYLEEHIQFHHAFPQGFTHVVDGIFSRLLLSKCIQQPDNAQIS